MGNNFKLIPTKLNLFRGGPDNLEFPEQFLMPKFLETPEMKKKELPKATVFQPTRKQNSNTTELF